MNMDFFSDILFPPSCLGCFLEIPSGVICPACQKSIELFKTLFCGTCNARLPEGKKICHKDAPYLLGTAARYDDIPVQKLIHALKFVGVKSAAQPLSRLLIKYISSLDIDIGRFVVIPIPLSEKRLRGRGFNQSQLIAQYFADHFSLPLEENLLIRMLHRKPQSETDDLLERKENIRGCFSAPYPDRLNDKNIILIDDVTTSGTTFLEAARVLKENGVKKILSLAVAQA